MLRALGYFLTRGLKGIWRNRFMSIAAVCIVTASLVLFGVFLLLGLNMNALLAQAQDQYEINVYLKEDADGATLNQIEEGLEAIPGVKEARFYSREDRLEKIKETMYQGKEYMLEDIEKDNRLRDSYILTVEDLALTEQVTEQATSVKGVEEVANLPDLVDRIRSVIETIQKAGGWIVLILALVAVFIITNTIRLGLAARGQEISVMRFVGASNWYICGPFMVEGMILGICGAILAAVLVLWGYQVSVEALSRAAYTNMIQLLSVSEVWHIVLGSFLGIGAGIGLLGSGISIRKYLKI